jgi:AAA domain
MAEKDYRKVARDKMYRPSSVERKPKILVYSRNKKGKTRFGTSAGVDTTIVFDPEYGTSEMRQADPHVWPIVKWSDMDDAIEWLRNVNECPICKPTHSFGWACVDGLTRLSNMALKHVGKLEEERSLTRIPGLLDPRRDYNKAGELLKDMLVRFHNMHDIGVIYTAQERMQEANDSEEDSDSGETEVTYVPDLPKSVRGHANSLVDIIGRLYVVKVENPKDPNGDPITQRRLWIGDSLKYDTGYRSDFVLPDYLRNPTVLKLVRLMREGTLKRTS